MTRVICGLALILNMGRTDLLCLSFSKMGMANCIAESRDSLRSSVHAAGLCMQLIRVCVSCCSLVLFWGLMHMSHVISCSTCECEIALKEFHNQIVTQPFVSINCPQLNLSILIHCVPIKKETLYVYIFPISSITFGRNLPQ